MLASPRSVVGRRYTRGIAADWQRQIDQQIDQQIGQRHHNVSLENGIGSRERLGRLASQWTVLRQHSKDHQGVQEQAIATRPSIENLLTRALSLGTCPIRQGCMTHSAY